MPKRTDLESILIIGAGPIVIGQACEFDYSGAQACKALKEEGYRVILVNSNPATIMTDPESADSIYIEPINWRTIERIIEKERPSALLPTMGGQTALNTALDLVREGVLEKFEVEMIGASQRAIDMAEDRELFRRAMADIGLETARARIAHSMEEALAVQSEIGFPTVIRPSFTLGGSGGGIAYNREEFEAIVARGLDASPTNEVLLEESVLGWKEYEMEVVRDRNDNCIIVCSIENLDPMGVHTGDSITVAPAQTLTDREYQRLRDASIAVLRKIGVDTGGSNVQFAVNPEDGRVLVIEMNPRVSRSSALASKATGFPIAKIAAKLAVGYTLDELKNEITGGGTPASFEPTIDYVVTKIPRFTFEKFPGSNTRLTTQMKSVGEAMAIGRTFQESIQKALRSLELGYDGFDEQLSVPLTEEASDKLSYELRWPGPNRILYVADAFRAGWTLQQVFDATKIDPWFLSQIEDLLRDEKVLREQGFDSLELPRMRSLKRKGFSDARIARLVSRDEPAVRKQRRKLGLHPVFKRVDTCAAEFATSTAYLYSSYDEECEANPTTRRKIMILGGGPNRIGQGIEFDYCCVHAAMALSEDGFETIMVNCNPETVSTDYDTSDRLYFEPLTFEDVMEIIEKEKPEGVIVQYGGQTPLKLSRALAAAGAPIIGTTPDSIDIAEDRERFQKLVASLKLKQPANATARARGAGGDHGARSRLSADRAAELCARRPGDGSGVQRKRSAPIHDRRHESLERQSRAARPVSRFGHRSRRRCRERRTGRTDRRHHGAHRAGRRALGRFRVLIAAERVVSRDPGRTARSDPQTRQSAQRRGTDEHPIRDPERRDLYPGGQSSRLSHGAVRLQSHRHPARQGGRPRDDRQVARQPRTDRRAHPVLLLGEGSSVSVHQVSRGRSDFGSGDEIDGRSHGYRAHLRRGVCQGASRLRRRIADARPVFHQRARSRQTRRRAARTNADRARLRDRRHRRHGEGPGGGGYRVPARE